MKEVKQSTALFVIKVGKKLFYNTPVHRSKIVNVLYEKIFHSAFGKGEIATVNYFGHTFKIPTDDITILPSMANNDYEALLLNLFKKVTKKGMVFADVGANIGIFSILGSKAVGSTGKVYSFEPEPNNFQLLGDNIKANRCNNVTSENLAVGDKKETLVLQIAKNSIGTHSLLSDRANEIDREITVNVVKLDDYFAKSKTKVDVMKIDVEGYEPQVLKGAKRTLATTKLLFFEYSKRDIESNSSIEELVGLLESFPNFYCIEEKSGQIIEFKADDFYKTKYANILAAKEPQDIIGRL